MLPVSWVEPMLTKRCCETLGQRVTKLWSLKLWGWTRASRMWFDSGRAAEHFFKPLHLIACNLQSMKIETHRISLKRSWLRSFCSRDWQNFEDRFCSFKGTQLTKGLFSSHLYIILWVGFRNKIYLEPILQIKRNRNMVRSALNIAFSNPDQKVHGLFLFYIYKMFFQRILNCFTCNCNIKVKKPMDFFVRVVKTRSALW